MTRIYRLAARPIPLGQGHPRRREIKELADDGSPPAVVVVVADADAMDVRDALEAVYNKGRMDRAGEDEG